MLLLDHLGKMKMTGMRRRVLPDILCAAAAL